MKGKRNKRNKVSGFTLFELLVVLAIVAMMMGLVPPLLSGLGPGTELRGAARQLAAGLRTARNTAVVHQQPTRLLIDLEQRYFQVTGNSRRVSLPNDIAIKLYTAQSELLDATTASIRFFPDGSATGGHVTFGDGRIQYTISVDWLTGQVSLEEQTAS